MRLRQLELQDFRNYKHLVINFDQERTLFIGENGTGKSTVFDAIQWLLTGQCRGVDGKGQGQKDLIRKGADTTVVTAVIDGLGPVTRTISRNGSASSSLPVDAILGKLGTTAGMLGTVLSGRTFFTMHHGDAKAMLMQVLNVTIPKDKLPGLKLPDTVDAVELPYLEQLYDQAFADRKTLKAALAAVAVPEAPKVVNIDLGGKSVTDLQVQLKRDQQDFQKAAGDQARAEHTATTARQKRDTAKQLAGTVEQLKGSLTAHQGMLDEHQGQLATAQAGLQEANDLAAEPTAALEIQLREAATLIDKIDRHTQGLVQVKGTKRKKSAEPEPAHTCVLGGGIPCLTAASEFTGAIDQLKATQKDLETRIKAGGERARKIAAAQQAVKESERHVTYHQGQVRELEQKIAAAEQAAKSLPDLDQAVATADAAVAAGSQSITERRADIERRQQQLTAQAQYDQAVKNHQAAVAKRADLQKQVDEAENLVTLLGPKGLRLTYLDQALADFHAAINAALEPFGFAVAINVEPWRVEVQRGAGTDWVRFEMLSKGQQMWTALAFQLTLAALSGLDFAILDDAEAVVGINRAVLTELILGAPVGQVLVAMAKAEDEAVPTVEGLQVYRIGPATGDQVRGDSGEVYEVGQQLTGS